MNKRLKKPAQFEIVDEFIKSERDHIEKPSKEQGSLRRLIANSEHIKELFTKRNELKHLRFDELDLLRDIRKIVASDPVKFGNIKDPSHYRRAIRSKVLPKYLTPDFIHLIREKILAQFFHSSIQSKDQDALMTALVFLQSHTDLGVPCEDNPLWEIVFNLSIKDGIRFVDSLTALIEGLDSIRGKNPEILTQDPPLLQQTMQVCQWPIFWRKLVEYKKDVQPFESLVSSLLRGEMMVELYFDEIIHLPLLLYRQFKDVIYSETSLNEKLTDIEKEEVSKIVIKNILKAASLDIPSLLPTLNKRLLKTDKKTINKKNHEKLKILINSLTEKDDVSNNIFLLTLLIAKISIKKYWENKRDFFFFFTILKNPEEPQNYYDYSQILIKLKYFDAINKILQCAIEIDKNSFWGYWGLGSYQLRVNKLQQSEKNLITALKIAQQLEIHAQANLNRELFLIKEDIKTLKQNKIRQQAVHQPQIDLF